MSQQQLIELNSSEALTEFSKFNMDLNKLTTESIEINRLVAHVNASIAMINQRTRILKKKGDCLRPYALKYYGISYPQIELEKIIFNPEMQHDESFYRYIPTSVPSLQLVGNDPNIPSSIATQQDSPLSKNGRNFSKTTPVLRTNGMKRNNSEEDEEDLLYLTQEKNLVKNPKM
jgi:hypothetical protein